MKIKTNWDLSSIFSGLDDPKLAEAEKRANTEVELFERHWRDRDDWLKNPAILKEALDHFTRLWEQFGCDTTRSYYLWLLSELDQNDPAIKAKLAKVQDNAQSLVNKLQFFSLRLGGVESTKQKEFLADPELAIYKHWLERLFSEHKYSLSEAEEKIVTLQSGPAFSNWVRLTENSLAKEERPVEGKLKTLAEIMSLANHTDKKTRDEAAKVFDQILKDKLELAEAELNSILEYKKNQDLLRRVSRPEELRLSSDDMELAVVDAMLESVEAAYPIAHEYYALKAKLLGQKKLAYHERGLEVGKLEKTYNFEQACQLTAKVFGQLDQEFLAIFKNFLEQGQIDAMPKKGKSSGACCAHQLKTLPTYILLNYTDQLRDVLTLAHEVGHGINNELMRAKCHALDFDSPLSTAEVASTLMEDFVLEELRKDASPAEQLNLLMAKLNDDVSTIFRQVAAYRFEQVLHQEFRAAGYLPAARIGELFRAKMLAYLGPSVEMAPGTENWWVHWSHFRNFFYVYSYASGLLISKNLQRKIRADKKFIGPVKTFLAAGSSASPRQLFFNLGLDITKPEFWTEALSQIQADLDLAKELASKL